MMMPGNPAGALSLYQMYTQNPPGQGGFFNGQSSRQTPWWMTAGQWRPAQQDDRSDQRGNNNQPDPGNAMAPPGQTPAGGPDNNPQSGYDTNTVSPGYDPGWMRMFGGGARAKGNANQAMMMGALGLNMLQPRPSTHTGPYPWI
jgi:hypothetical protein